MLKKEKNKIFENLGKNVQHLKIFWKKAEKRMKYCVIDIILVFLTRSLPKGFQKQDLLCI